jgi:arylsulfatase A-like enzyme
VSLSSRASLLAVSALLGACGGGGERPPNVLLISIDTLRADRLGCQGYERDTTPALDDFGQRHALRFANATAESPWTLPSHVTMLSGLHPLTHGVRTPQLAPGSDVELLAEILARSGWYCFGLTDGGWLDARWGFDRGFDSFEAQDRDVQQLVDEALAFVHHREPRGPWFGFLHTYDVHCPYDPPPPYRGRFTSADAEPIEVEGRCGNPHFNRDGVTAGQARFLSDRYDEDVRRVDDALGRLLADLEERGLLDHTIVVVTSDHGEEFGEHGQIGHERTLHREVLAIPLLVAAPGLAPAVVERPAGLADVVPTLLDLLGLEPGSELDGRSLLARGSGGVASDLAWQSDLCAWTTASEQLIVDRESDRARYFDLVMDPWEEHDRATLVPERARALREPLSRYQASLAPRRLPRRLLADYPDDLEALGYAEGR